MDYGTTLVKYKPAEATQGNQRRATAMVTKTTRMHTLNEELVGMNIRESRGPAKLALERVRVDLEARRDEIDISVMR